MTNNEQLVEAMESTLEKLENADRKNYDAETIKALDATITTMSEAIRKLKIINLSQRRKSQ